MEREDGIVLFFWVGVSFFGKIGKGKSYQNSLRDLVNCWI